MVDVVVDLGPSPLDRAEEHAAVAGLTEAILTRQVPEELGLWRAHREELLDRVGRAPEAGPDEELGIGEVLVALTPWLVTAATVAVRYLATLVAGAAADVAKSELKDWLRRLIHDEPAGPAGPAPLDAATLGRVRTAVSDVLVRLGAGEEEVALARDAVVGQLMGTG